MRSNEPLAKIDALLQVWARWSLSDRYGLGYASRNTIHRCMHQGAIRRPYDAPQSIPEYIERTKQAVAQLLAHLRAVSRGGDRSAPRRRSRSPLAPSGCGSTAACTGWRDG